VVTREDNGEEPEMPEDKKKGSSKTIIAIAGCCGGLAFVTILVLAILAKESLDTVGPWVLGSMTVLGIGLGMAASKKEHGGS
jgi:hypothetical protein